ncbi:CHC2 zinc finger domain-containing protein [Mycobacterium intracellulare]|uniref:CHC2 zinc finger domain-containing protein n=1 Tax=Mycobacterium intracellulare TaxID=1767 RepID=UPI0037CA80E3
MFQLQPGPRELSGRHRGLAESDQILREVRVSDVLIVRVIQKYYPDWEPPPDRGREWAKTTCPFHGDTRPSASISFQHNAFKCYACPVKGSAAGIIKLKEEVSYAEAQRLAEEISGGSHEPVPRKSSGESRRAVFGDARPDRPEHQGGRRKVPPRVRRRPTFGA